MDLTIFIWGCALAILVWSLSVIYDFSIRDIPTPLLLISVWIIAYTPILVGIVILSPPGHTRYTLMAVCGFFAVLGFCISIIEGGW